MYVESDGTTWGCILGHTDIKTNSNKFYELILEQSPTPPPIYTVICRYGRIGSNGRTIKKNFASSVLAAKWYFEKQFKTKTGNEWASRHSFQKKSNKYWIQQLYGTKKKKDDTDPRVKQILLDILERLDEMSDEEIDELTKEYYSLVPKNTGRKKPPRLDDREIVQAYLDSLENK